MSTTSCPFSGRSASTVASPSHLGSSGCPFSEAKVLPTRPSPPSTAIPAQYLNSELTSCQKELIKASVPALAEHGLDITKLFYNNMLQQHPVLKDMFNNSNQEHFEQPRALANAVMAYAINIDDLTPLLPAVDLITNKHASLHVQPEHYGIVGKLLIAAIAEVLGDAVTPELGQAWTLAYWKLAEILMNREEQLYTNSQGWTDWADFKIARKERESAEITSFYLEPLDPNAKPLPPFLPGQYISIQVDVPQLGHKQARQYSLSDSPNADYYRVSIKREDAERPGLISVLMHDTKQPGDVISVAHPRGDFFLKPDISQDAPLVFVSGGVGLTPLNSMLKSAIKTNPNRPISWIHGARSASVRPFVKSILDLQAQSSTQVSWFNSLPGPAEVQGQDYHFEGNVDLTRLDEPTLFLNDTSAQYYICGPTRFMAAMNKGLQERGIPSSRIHMELFGTGGVPTV